MLIFWVKNTESRKNIRVHCLVEDAKIYMKFFLP